MESLETKESNESTFLDEINAIASKMTEDDKGNWHLPEGEEVSKEVMIAANLERRRRSTESALSKSTLKLKASESVSKQLKDRIAALIAADISPEKQKELDDIKYEEPDTYHVEMSKLESKARATLESELGDLDSTALQEAENEARKMLLEKYNSEHPDAMLDDNIINNDIPPRIVNQLAKGDITFEQFLEKVETFLGKGKVIGGGTEIKPQPNLNKTGGDSEPTVTQGEKIDRNKQKYENAVL